VDFSVTRFVFVRLVTSLEMPGRAFFRTKKIFSKKEERKQGQVWILQKPAGKGS